MEQLSSNVWVSVTEVYYKLYIFIFLGVTGEKFPKLDAGSHKIIVQFTVAASHKQISCFTESFEIEQISNYRS